MDIDSGLRKERFDQAISTITKKQENQSSYKDLNEERDGENLTSDFLTNNEEDQIDIQEVTEDEEENKRNGPDDKKDVKPHENHIWTKSAIFTPSELKDLLSRDDNAKF